MARNLVSKVVVRLCNRVMSGNSPSSLGGTPTLSTPAMVSSLCNHAAAALVTVRSMDDDAAPHDLVADIKPTGAAPHLLAPNGFFGSGA
jgi:hypothetical protein